MSGGNGEGGDWRPDPKPPVKPQPGGEGEGGGGGGQPDDVCNIVEQTNLNSVNAAVLATVRVGDILDVVYEPGPPRRLLARNAAGETAGSITSPSMPQVIICISDRGVVYEAEVLAVRGGICSVEVRPRA